MPNFNKKNSNGLSLIEVLVALVLFSFIMIAVFTLTDSASKAKEQITSEDSETLRIETVLSRIDWDISQMYTPLYYDELMSQDYMRFLTSNEQTLEAMIQRNQYALENFPSYTKNWAPIPKYDSIPKTSFTFLSLSNRKKIVNEKTTRLNWIKYSVESSKDSNNSLLELRRYAVSSNIYAPQIFESSQIKSQILISNLKSIEFKFWDKYKMDFVEEFSFQNENVYPVTALKLSFVYIDSNKREIAMEKIFRPLWHRYEIESTRDLIKLQNNLAPIQEEQNP